VRVAVWSVEEDRMEMGVGIMRRKMEVVIAR